MLRYISGVAFPTRKEIALKETVELDGHFYVTMNLGGPVFFAMEGKESKKLVVRAEYVDELRKVFGERRIRVHERLISTEKDLDAFFQVASQNLQKKIPAFVCIMESVPE